ncbi:MAG: hypothetical protein ACOYOJ_13865 [Alsobacter sp.]
MPPEFLTPGLCVFDGAAAGLAVAAGACGLAVFHLARRTLQLLPFVPRLPG